MLLEMKYGSQTNNPLILKWKPPGGTTIKAYNVAENIRQHTKEKTHVWKREKVITKHTGILPHTSKTLEYSHIEI